MPSVEWAVGVPTVLEENDRRATCHLHGGVIRRRYERHNTAAARNEKPIRHGKHSGSAFT